MLSRELGRIASQISRSVTATNGFVIPPENQGQIVEVSYDVGTHDEKVVVQIYDRSDRSYEYQYGYEVIEKDDEGNEIEPSFDPQNGAPDLEGLKDISAQEASKILGWIVGGDETGIEQEYDY